MQFRKASVVIVCASALLTLVSGCAAVVPPQSYIGDSSRIVVALELQPPTEWGESPYTAKTQIYSVVPNGTNIQQLTFGCDYESPETFCDDFFPAISPDGKRLAFTRYYDYDGSRTGLYTVNTDGTGFKFMVPGGYHPSWSPDGTQIAFVQPTAEKAVGYFTDGKFGDQELGVNNFGDLPRLHIINADGTAQRIVTDEAFAYHPSWSPDGQRITFKGGNGNLYVVNKDGTSLRVLVEYGDKRLREGDRANPQNPAWSPDGTRIAFHLYHRSSGGTLGKGSSIYTINVDGTNLKRIGQGEAPRWSPDSKYILFRSDYDDPNDNGYSQKLFYMGSTDGSNVRRVTRALAATNEDDITYFRGRGETQGAHTTYSVYLTENQSPEWYLPSE